MITAATAAAPLHAQTPEVQRWYADGVRALESGRFAEAKEDLLKVVAADPAFAGAWLDLAIAAHALGDVAEAEEFLGILEARFTLPDGIARGVAALRNRIQAAQPATRDWVWRARALAGGGYDSNANAGLAATDLTLTFPTGGIALPVADALRPRADAYALASLSLEGSRRSGAGQWEASGQLKARRNASVNDFDSLEMHAGMGYASNVPAFGGEWARLLPGPWRVGANFQHLRLGGNALLNSLSFSGIHAWTHLRCAPQASVELDLRAFPAAPSLNSSLAWLGGSIDCGEPWVGATGGWGVHARVGHESARDGARPGGNTWHMEAALSHRWNWLGERGPERVEALVQAATARDTAGYSPLLANNARRKVLRGTAGVSYSFPLSMLTRGDAHDWEATLTFQAFHQGSNLQLFRLRGAALQMTIQKGF